MNKDKIVEAIINYLKENIAPIHYTSIGPHAVGIYAAIAPLIEPRVISVKELADKFYASQSLQELHSISWRWKKEVVKDLAALAVPYIRQKEDVQDDTNISGLDAREIPYEVKAKIARQFLGAPNANDILMWIVRVEIIADILAPYIRRMPEGRDKVISEKELAGLFDNRLFPICLSSAQSAEIAESLASIAVRHFRRAREVAVDKKALLSKDAEIERLKTAYDRQAEIISHFEYDMGMANERTEKAEADSKRLKAELSVFKEGMRAIKSALDFIQSN